MTLAERIDVMVWLGETIKQKPEWLNEAVNLAYIKNKWFVQDNSWLALNAIKSSFLDEEVLINWTNSYNIPDLREPKTVGLILAGNIPLVGFHDILSVFISGHKSLMKFSSKDEVLIPALLSKVIEQFPTVENYFKITERLTDYDAVVATGSNNTNRYFKQYFSKYPNILRQNRNAVAVFHGEETKEDIMRLGHDMFQYFGLGCRNVSKIYLPKGYDVKFILEVLHDEFKEIIHHNKYRNNFDYNNSLFLLNKEDFLMNGAVLFKEEDAIASRIACIHYTYYDSLDNLSLELISRQNEIQCIVSGKGINGFSTFLFGEAQKPKIDDYADGVDTMLFLNSELKS